MKTFILATKDFKANRILYKIVNTNQFSGYTFQLHSFVSFEIGRMNCTSIINSNYMIDFTV